MPSPVLDRAMEVARVDFSPPHRPPAAARVAAATVASLAACLLADWLLARAAVAVFPATKGYVHFQFGDYSKLTIIGVLIACAGWPVVARVTSAPRWVFFRLAILVTIVLLLPDLYIWVQGQPGHAVLFLVFMHLAIALITYNLLVHMAPVRPAAGAGRDRGRRGTPPYREAPSGREAPSRLEATSHREAPYRPQAPSYRDAGPSQGSPAYADPGPAAETQAYPDGLPFRDSRPYRDSDPYRETQVYPTSGAGQGAAADRPASPGRDAGAQRDTPPYGQRRPS